MITTHEDAVRHANHAIRHKFNKNVVVLPDGQMYVGEDDGVQKAIDSNEGIFIVKGDLKKTEKKKKKTDD